MSSVRDVLIISVLLFAVGISILFAVDIGHRVNSQILSTPIINSSVDAVSVVEHSDAAINMVDYIYLALFVGFFIALIVSGWFVGGSPIAAPIYFFVVVIFTFISVILQYVWVDLSTNSQVFNATLSLPITTFILNNLGYFTAVMGLLGIIAMFAKPADRSVNY